MSDLEIREATSESGMELYWFMDDLGLIHIFDHDKEVSINVPEESGNA